MSKLSDRIERLEEQQDVAEGGAVLILYRQNGTCRVGEKEYASEEDAKTAHPAETYLLLPENGR